MAGLVKQKKYDWKDSNLALFGSDTERQVKKESAQTEPAWENAGKSVGTQIWRIVKFKVTHWPKEDYGKFYDGDSYIILNAIAPEGVAVAGAKGWENVRVSHVEQKMLTHPEHTYKEEGSDELLYDVHFWIGKYSTQDEYGTAAYKTVELDTLLDDKPIQHREVQGHESELFKTYFKAITTMSGGADSGFRHVQAEKYTPRLLHFHGDKNHVDVKQVSRIRSKLDSTDVFILDMGLMLYQWQGKDCNKDEKTIARDYVQKLRNERGGKCQSEVLDEYSTEEDHEFYRTLDQGEEDDDSTDPVQTTGETTLHRISDASGKMKVTHEKSGKINLSDFDTKDVFILDTTKDVFVWIGKQTSINERRNAMSYAHSYLMTSSHPLIPVCCLSEGTRHKGFEVAVSA